MSAGGSQDRRLSFAWDRGCCLSVSRSKAVITFDCLHWKARVSRETAGAEPPCFSCWQSAVSAIVSFGRTLVSHARFLPLPLTNAITLDDQEYGGDGSLSATPPPLTFIHVQHPRFFCEFQSRRARSLVDNSAFERITFIECS